MIDRLRNDIQKRLGLILAKADKLRGALRALDTRGSNTSKPSPAPSAPARRPATRRSGAPAARTAAARTARRPGATKGAVLQALRDRDAAMTAGDVAAVTALRRPTVSTTLSTLARTGEVTKAKRGYALPRVTTTAETPGTTSSSGRDRGRP